jgi:hypothetical protein
VDSYLPYTVSLQEQKKIYISNGPTTSNQTFINAVILCPMVYYRGADKFLTRPTSPCILFDGENISLMLVFLYT